jgi:uncharacterized protein YlxW (UPF0749 family)
LRGWRLIAVAAFIAAGTLFATSGLNSHGVDLRASSVTDLDTVLLHERGRVDSMQTEVARLNGQVTTLTQEVNDSGVDRLQRRVEKLKGPAGFEAVSGPGVTVTLNDAPKSVIDSAVESGAVSADNLVVHQQDIQAVVNALWLGGAEAITVRGQRIISTTGIKCVGNTVVLHGVPYAPPYDISAIGDTTQLIDSLDSSDYVAAYQTFVQQYQLGWALEASTRIDMPAYIGTADLRYATPGPTKD